jgi:hypothetical protein
MKNSFFTDPLVVILNIVYLVICAFGVKWGNSYLFWPSLKETAFMYLGGFFVFNFVLWRLSDPNYNPKDSPARFCPSCNQKLNGIPGLTIKKCPYCTADF